LTLRRPAGSIAGVSAARRKQSAEGPQADPPTPEEGASEAGVGGFEASLEELEGLVDRLESGDLSLEDALATFEAGVALTRRCAEQLGAAERRIEALVREGGQWVERPFDGAEDGD
jgi:exodeoxyribonuclease VII small subunit